MERFGAPWDRGLKLTTWMVVVLVAGLGGGMLLVGRSAFDAGGAPVSGLLIGGALMLALLPMLWALAPRGFALDGGFLVVERPLWPVRVPLAAIRGVTALPGLGLAVRTAGASGVFGHYGRYWSTSLGAFRLYATRRHRLVCVDVDGGRFVLSPDQPERFIAALLRHAPRARHQATPEHLPGSSGRSGSARAVVGALSLAALVAGCILAGALGWAPRAVSVTDEAVRIERRWAGPVLLPLDAIRSAELLAPGLASGWWRVNGTAGLGGASYGRFSSHRLGGFRLYAWRQGPYVLLETVEGKVILTPDDPAGFLEALRARLPAPRR